MKDVRVLFPSKQSPLGRPGAGTRSYIVGQHLISVRQTIINLVQVMLDKIPFISLGYLCPQTVLKCGYYDYSLSPDKESKVPETKRFAQGE